MGDQKDDKATSVPSTEEPTTAQVDAPVATTEEVDKPAQPEAKGTQVPYSAMYAERKRRQDAESKISTMQGRLDQLEAKSQPEEVEFTPEQLDALKRANEQLGYVPREQVMAEQAKDREQDVINAFVKANPQYAPGVSQENDSNWANLTTAMDDYTKSTPAQLEKALKRAHGDITGTDLNQQAELKAQAVMQTNKMASVGGVGGASTNDEPELTPEEQRRSEAWDMDPELLKKAKAINKARKV